MNFIHPYLEIYFKPTELREEVEIPFYKEVVWIFLKNLDSRLKLLQHRLNINFTNDTPTREFWQFGSIFMYDIKLDKQFFKDAGELEKREKLLDIIYLAFSILGKEYEWNQTAIEDAYIKSKPEINKFEYYTEFKINRNKKYSGQLRLQLFGNELQIVAIIKNNHDGKCLNFNLLNTDEGNLSWYRRIKKFGWLDNNKFGLKFIDGDLWIVLDVENNVVKDIVKPKKSTLGKINELMVELKKPAYKTV